MATCIYWTNYFFGEWVNNRKIRSIPITALSSFTGADHGLLVNKQYPKDNCKENIVSNVIIE